MAVSVLRVAGVIAGDLAPVWLAAPAAGRVMRRVRIGRRSERVMVRGDGQAAARALRCAAIMMLASRV